jgi:hypothetical protein
MVVQIYKIFIKLFMSSKSLQFQWLIADFVPSVDSKDHFILVNYVRLFTVNEREKKSPIFSFVRRWYMYNDKQQATFLVQEWNSPTGYHCIWLYFAACTIISGQLKCHLDNGGFSIKIAILSDLIVL